MREVNSESPDGQKRIVIEPSTETVKFIRCYIRWPTTFFTIHVRSEDEYVCPYTDILGVYESNMTQPGHGPRRMILEIITSIGKAESTQSWSNYDEAKAMLKLISEATPDPPWHRNPKTMTRLMLLVGFIITVIIISSIVWFGIL